MLSHKRKPMLLMIQHDPYAMLIFSDTWFFIFNGSRLGNT
jgi:hypothetical protein